MSKEVEQPLFSFVYRLVLKDARDVSIVTPSPASKEVEQGLFSFVYRLVLKDARDVSIVTRV